jgi:hypothetical protein
MLISPETMRLLLLTGLLAMTLLAAVYLSRRSLSLLEYIGWGILIFMLPLVGPFLAILARPGSARLDRHGPASEGHSRTITG